jgi:hypothetical protein
MQVEWRMHTMEFRNGFWQWPQDKGISSMNRQVCAGHTQESVLGAAVAISQDLSQHLRAMVLTLIP